MDSRTLLTALVCLAAGLGIGLLMAPAPDVPAGDPVVSDGAGTPAAAPQAGPALDSVETALAARQAELEQEGARRMQAEAELQRLRAEVAQLKADAEAGRLAGGAERSTTVRYGAGGRFQKSLAAMDWEEAGQALSRMTPLMGELVTSRLEGKPPPPSVGDIQKYNGALVKLALRAQQDGIPGSGANGSFTHVAVVANLVHATLKQAGLPLDAAQEERLGRLADELLSEDARRIASYGDETLVLRKLLEETTLKDRFYAGVDALVSDEQREALHPEALRGRASFDLFSSGLVWAQHLAPQRFTDKSKLNEMLVGQLLGRYGIGAEQRPLVEEVVGEWIAALPASMLDKTVDTLVLTAGAVETARIRTSATVQLAAMERLLQRLPADDAAVAKIRAEDKVAVPLKIGD
ncbi:MAG: hypothetical protein P1V36_12655 [Planctomycetota bacterium]|nr:hypothetical protein [Planctomycetota bacterium]